MNPSRYRSEPEWTVVRESSAKPAVRALVRSAAGHPVLSQSRPNAVNVAAVLAPMRSVVQGRPCAWLSRERMLGERVSANPFGMRSL